MIAQVNSLSYNHLVYIIQAMLMKLVHTFAQWEVFKLVR